MPPLEGPQNTFYSNADRYPQEYADLVARTEQGEFKAYRAVWAGNTEYEDATLFVPRKVSVEKAKKAYENLADENYIVLPITIEEAKDRIMASNQKREEERVRNLPKPDPIFDVHGYADILRQRHQEDKQKPGLIKRILGRISLPA